MKLFSCNQQQFRRCFALTAAWVFSFAAVGAQPSFYASAEEAGAPVLEGETADEAAEGADETNPLGALEIKPDMGSYTFYRWERVTRDNFPEDDEEHRSLLLAAYPPEIISDNDNNCDGFSNNHNFLNGVAPGCLWFGYNVNPKSTIPESNRKTEWWVKNYVSVRDNEYDRSYYVGATYNMDSAKDIRPGSTVFYTDSDYDTPFLQLAGMDNKNKNVGGSQCRKYTIRLKSNNSHKYYIWGNNDKDGYLDVDVDDRNTGHAWTLHCWSCNGEDVWEAYKEEGSGDDDEGLITMDNYGMSYIDDDEDHCGCLYEWYIGEEMVFSGIKEKEFEIPKGMVYAVGKGGVVDTTSNSAKQMAGILLNEGHKIKVCDGGILSIEGTLLNNGTIEVEAGGLLLVKDGGCIAPFTSQTGNPSVNGDGAIKCSGDIIIQPGGAIFGGVGAEGTGAMTEFNLDKGANLINQGLLVYGGLRMADSSRLELYPDSRTMGCRYTMQYQFTGYPYQSAKITYGGNSKEETWRIAEQSLNENNVTAIYLPTSKNVDLLLFFFGKRGNSVYFTDMLSFFVSTYRQGKDSTLLKKISNWENRYSDLYEFNEDEIAKAPVGLYIGQKVPQNKPNVKIMKGANFEDPFFENQYITYTYNADIL